MKVGIPKAYDKIAKGTYCSGDFIEVPTEAECKTAATSLGLTYFRTENSDTWFPACFVMDNKVRFNKHSNPKRPECTDVSFCRLVAAICKGIQQ